MKDLEFLWSIIPLPLQAMFSPKTHRNVVSKPPYSKILVLPFTPVFNLLAMDFCVWNKIGLQFQFFP